MSQAQVLGGGAVDPSPVPSQHLHEAWWAAGRVGGTFVPPWTAPPWAARDTGRAMSEESTTPDLAELTRRAMEASNRHDLDTVMQFYAP